MGVLSENFIARARTDESNWLVEAQEPLASLQRSCGGVVPGSIAIPELRELVDKVHATGLKFARMVSAFDGEDEITAWAEVAPTDNGGGGCEIGIANWQSRPIPDRSETDEIVRSRAIDEAAGELFARLGARQQVLTVQSNARDLVDLVDAMREGQGRSWTEFVKFSDHTQAKPLHWRLLDGSRCSVDGSDRQWRVRLVPLGQPHAGSTGFDLILVADAPLDAVEAIKEPDNSITMGSLGRDLAPVLRQPIARIIANAWTIRAKMAGPLSEQYSDYASDISEAGEHLLALIDDLSALEEVESDAFSIVFEQVDVSDIARRAAGLLAVHAKEANMILRAPSPDAVTIVTAQSKRVLQILLNLLSNAIRYSSPGSIIEISTKLRGDTVLIGVTDNGPGLGTEQQDRVFEKFERLGRIDDSGSGLGLYISRKIAHAMHGSLTVESEPGEGTRFTLALPVAVVS